MTFSQGLEVDAGWGADDCDVDAGVDDDDDDDNSVAPLAEGPSCDISL